jgi:carbonic anhydrase
VEFSWEPFGSARGSGEETAAEPPPPVSPEREPGPAAPSFRRLPREPTRKLVVISCMDSRVDPLAALGLALGEAHVIRNAGATVTDDVLRGLRVSQSRLGTRRAVLLGHTDCAGHDSDAAAEAGLVDGIRRIRGAGAVPDSFGLEALIYDVATGEVRSVG